MVEKTADLWTPVRNARALAGFAYRFGPMFWRRLQEDRARVVEAAPRRPLFKSWREQGLQAAWIGHSTVLIRLDGFTIR